MCNSLFQELNGVEELGLINCVVDVVICLYEDIKQELLAAIDAHVGTHILELLKADGSTLIEIVLREHFFEILMRQRNTFYFFQIVLYFLFQLLFIELLPVYYLHELLQLLKLEALELRTEPFHSF